MAGEFSEGLLYPPSSFPKEVRLWPDNKLTLLSDKTNHLLFSPEFGKAPRAIILVTGYPERAGMLADSSGTTLEGFFGQANEEISMAQVYTGSIFPRPVSDLSYYLKHALEEAGDSTKIDLVVYSAGAISLKGIPEKCFDRIDSLTFVSPLVGRKGVRQDSRYSRKWVRALMRIAGIPKTDDYAKSIDPLIKNLQKRGKPINVVLGEKDELIDNEAVEKLFKDNFPDVPITTNPRTHAATIEEILTPIR